MMVQVSTYTQVIVLLLGNSYLPYQSVGQVFASDYTYIVITK